MKQVGAALICLAIIWAGLQKRSRIREEIQILRDYELALEQLRQCICYEKISLKQALKKAANGRGMPVHRCFQRGAEGLAKGAQDVSIQGHVLPLSGLSATGQAQERLLMNLAEEVRNDRLQKESKQEERCRSCMSVAVALSAICAIVLL